MPIPEPELAAISLSSVHSLILDELREFVRSWIARNHDRLCRELEDSIQRGLSQGSMTIEIRMGRS